MKIGIITHHYVKNYGAFLQVYALQETLKNMYPNAEILVINHINIKHYLINFLGWFRFNYKNDNLRSYLQKFKVPFMFRKFEKKYLNITKRVFSTRKINKMKFDTIIIGSDEVWNFSDSKSYSPLKYGVGLDCNNIITYAPSVGGSNINEIPKSIKDGLKNIKSFSSRDDLTEKMVEKIASKKCERVVDPTFLYDFPKYESNLVSKIKTTNYILIYYCDNIPPSMIEKIQKFAKKNDYKIYGAGDYKKWFDKFTVCVNPFEWIEMFKNAKIVFTGTFHGTVFSIKSRATFYNYIGNKSRSKKINSLLNELNIDERSLEKNNIIEDNMNYDLIYKALNEKTANSVEYLMNNIRR